MKVKKVNYVVLIIIFLSLPFWARAQAYQTPFDSIVKPNETKNTSTTFQAVLKTDSTSWTMAHQELFGIVIEYFYAITYQDSAFSKIYINDEYNTYMGKLRENADEGKVWFTNAVNNEEYLMMDMNLQISDTFEIKPGLWSEVDTIYYFEEKKVIQFNLYSWRWDEPVQFIEGVGPNNAFSVFSDFDWFYVTCKYDQGELNYVNNNSHFIGCMPDPTGVEEEKANYESFVLMPNPCSGILEIKFLDDQNKKVTVSIFDLYGQVLKHFDFETVSNQMDLNDLTNGMYFLRLEIGTSIITKTVIIKH